MMDLNKLMLDLKNFIEILKEITLLLLLLVIFSLYFHGIIWVASTMYIPIQYSFVRQPERHSWTLFRSPTPRAFQGTPPRAQPKPFDYTKKLKARKVCHDTLLTLCYHNEWRESTMDSGLASPYFGCITNPRGEGHDFFQYSSQAKPTHRPESAHLTISNFLAYLPEVFLPHLPPMVSKHWNKTRHGVEWA